MKFSPKGHSYLICIPKFNILLRICFQSICQANNLFDLMKYWNSHSIVFDWKTLVVHWINRIYINCLPFRSRETEPPTCHYFPFYSTLLPLLCCFKGTLTEGALKDYFQENSIICGIKVSSITHHFTGCWHFPAGFFSQILLTHTNFSLKKLSFFFRK